MKINKNAEINRSKAESKVTGKEGEGREEMQQYKQTSKE